MYLKDRFLLFCFLMVFLFWEMLEADAGYVEERSGKTIIHVKVWQLPDPSNGSPVIRADVETVKLFREHFPEIFKRKYRAKYQADPGKYGNYNWDNVEIQLDKFSSLEVEGVETDLLAIAGGIAPDILYINFRKSDTYIRNGFLYPLDKYFATLTPKQLRWYVDPKLDEVIRRKGPDGKLHWWVLPYGGIQGKVLLYRKDLFDKQGIKYPDKDWTWNDLYAACQKISDPANGIYGIYFMKGKMESWNWINFLWSAGGEVMVHDKNKDEWKCVFDSDAAVKALDFYTRLSAERWLDKQGKIHHGYAYKETSDAGIKWTRGEIGMRFDSIREDILSIIRPENTGIAPVPLGPDGQRGGELNSRMFGIFSGVDNPVVRDAAWEYMLFWNSKKAFSARTKILVEGGYGPFVNPKYLKMFGYQDILKLCPKGWKENFKIAIATGKPEPCGKNSNLAYLLMTYPLQEAEQLEKTDRLPLEPEARYKVLKALLVNGCERANRMMIGKLTDSEIRLRRICAWSALLIIAVTFILVFRKIFKAFTPETATGKPSHKWGFRKYAWAYILLIPAVLSIFVWSYVPLARGSYMAFFDYKLLGKSVFVGVDNFGNLLFNADWWNSVWNAIRYSFLIMSMTFLPPVILAIFLQEVPRCKILFRTLYYLPAVITGLVVMLLWKQFFEGSENGLLNAIVLKIPAIAFIFVGLVLLLVCLAFARRLRFYELWLPMAGFVVAGLLLFYTVASLASSILFPAGEGFWQCVRMIPSRLFNVTPEAKDWLGNPDLAMFACVLPMVWAGMGPGCLIYLAALKGIPNDYYEAADMDGATFIDKILFVVFPMLKALIIINFVGVFISSFMRSTGMILAMTGGGANTTTAGLHIWFEAFTFLRFGPATAMAWTLGFILIGFTIHQLRILSRVEFKTTSKK